MINSLKELEEILDQFANERDWEQFHSPKNLAMALGVEVAELAEHFQWLTQEQSQHLSADKKQQVGEEMADVLIYLVRLAHRLEIDLLDEADRKVQRNAEKYPVSLSKGRSDPPKSQQGNS